MEDQNCLLLNAYIDYKILLKTHKVLSGLSPECFHWFICCYFTAFHCHPIKSKSSVESTLTAISIPPLGNTLSQSCSSKRNLMNSVTNMDNTVHLWCKWMCCLLCIPRILFFWTSVSPLPLGLTLTPTETLKSTEINVVCLTFKVMQREHLVDLGKYKYVTGLSKQEKHSLKKKNII